MYLKNFTLFSTRSISIWQLQVHPVAHFLLVLLEVGLNWKWAASCCCCCISWPTIWEEATLLKFNGTFSLPVAFKWSIQKPDKWDSVAYSGVTRGASILWKCSSHLSSSHLNSLQFSLSRQLPQHLIREWGCDEKWCEVGLSTVSRENANFLLICSINRQKYHNTIQHTAQEFVAVVDLFRLFVCFSSFPVYVVLCCLVVLVLVSPLYPPFICFSSVTIGLGSQRQFNLCSSWCHHDHDHDAVMVLSSITMTITPLSTSFRSSSSCTIIA